jgi:hypothetical protein
MDCIRNWNHRLRTRNCLHIGFQNTQVIYRTAQCTYPHGVPKHKARDRGPPHCTKNAIYVFPELKLHGLVPSSYVHVSVSDFYVFPDTSAWMWKLGDITLYFCFGNKEVSQFHFWEHINWNQTFILDSQQPFICSAAQKASTDIMAIDRP